MASGYNAIVADLSFYGIGVHVEGDPKALDGLLRDFNWFAAEHAPSPLISWRLDLGPATTEAPRGWRGRGFRAWDEGSTREVRYEDGAGARYDFATNQGAIWAQNSGRLHELGYLAVLASAGEHLDFLGLHRVHALGFVFGGHAGLLMLPSNGGKSVIGLRLLADPRFMLLSEDTPILDRDINVRPFPLRLSMRPGSNLSAVPEPMRRPYSRLHYGQRTLIEVDFFRKRLSSPAPLRWLLAGIPAAAGVPGAIESSKFAVTRALLSGLVIGVGVPQMAEWRLRPNAIHSLASIAIARAAIGARALRRSQSARFQLDSNPDHSVSLLADWLES